MKQFLIFVKKEFIHIFRDQRTILILLVMPIVQIILFGFAISTELKNANLAILLPSKDIYFEKLAQKIDASEYFTITHYPQSKETIDTLFRRGEIQAAIVFENNFSKNLSEFKTADIQIITDASDPNQATMITNYLTSIINSFQSENIPPYDKALNININLRLLYNPLMKSAYNFVPGVMGLVLMLICAMMTSISIVREKERGTMEVLLVSPVKPIFMIIAKVIPYLSISGVNVITILLISVFVFQVPIVGSIAWLFLFSLIFIFVSLAMGIMISTIVDSQVAAMLVSGLVLMMPTMLLSGMIFPLENTPFILQFISNFIPARWFISSVKKIMIEGLDIKYAIKELIILCFMAIVLTFISLKKFKIRL